jgi:hypothetical protein
VAQSRGLGTWGQYMRCLESEVKRAGKNPVLRPEIFVPSPNITARGSNTTKQAFSASAVVFPGNIVLGFDTRQARRIPDRDFPNFQAQSIDVC